MILILILIIMIITIIIKIITLLFILLIIVLIILSTIVIITVIRLRRALSLHVQGAGEPPSPMNEMFCGLLRAGQPGRADSGCGSG